MDRTRRGGPWQYEHLLTVSFVPPAALQLPPPRGSGAGPALPQHPRDALAHGDHLGRCQPAEDVPAQHEGPAGALRVALGLLHQPERHRLPHEVGASLGQGRTAGGFGLRGSPAGAGRSRERGKVRLEMAATCWCSRARLGPSLPRSSARTSQAVFPSCGGVAGECSTNKCISGRASGLSTLSRRQTAEGPGLCLPPKG